MRIIVNGLPFFSKKIVKDLNEFDTENSYRFFDTYYSKFAQYRFLFNLLFADVVISFNGVSSESNSLNWAIRFRKKLVMQWHGTDVLLAKQRKADRTINSKYINYAEHFISAPWFKDELKNVVPSTTYVPFGYVDAIGNNVHYSKISILTYIGVDNEEFYGWDSIKELALKYPDIEISVVGMSKNTRSNCENIRFYGWVSEEELSHLMRAHPVFIRLTKHDGKAVSVSQALGAGCEVIWTQNFDHCHYVDGSIESLFEKFEDVQKIIIARNFSPNKENIEFVRSTMSRNAVMKNYLENLKSVLND